MTAIIVFISSQETHISMLWKSLTYYIVFNISKRMLFCILHVAMFNWVNHLFYFCDIPNSWTNINVCSLFLLTCI